MKRNEVGGSWISTLFLAAFCDLMHLSSWILEIGLLEGSGLQYFNFGG